MSSEPRNLTIAEAQREMREGHLTSRELVSAVLERIASRQGEVGAFITVTADAALEAADAADARRRSGSERGPLDGIPVAIKDNLLVEGVRATAASKMLEGYVASYDATVIGRLRSAGAVLVGKTNLDEFAMGSSTENSGLGVTRNPHDLDRVPGGSSGGSAAAVADAQALAALGTDTGGSIRQPAAFCGVAGFKPTYGAVSRSGAIALASSLDQIGPFAKTARDAATVFATIAGHDPLDATSSKGNVAGDVADALARGADQLTIGIPREYLSGDLAPEVAKAFEEVRAKFESLGHKVVEVSLPHTNLSLACYYIIQPAEASSNLARYDGIRYAPPAGTGGSLDERYLHARGVGFGAETKRRIVLGTFVLSSGYYDAYYGKAQSARTLITRDFDEAFEKVDALLTPVTPTTAFKRGEKSSDPVAMYLSDIFTIPANLAGLPALALPAAPRGTEYAPDSMPIGFQIMAPKFADARVLRLGVQYEEA